MTLPIASVPNLQPGDRLWLHPDLPADTVGSLPDGAGLPARNDQPAARTTGSSALRPGTKKFAKKALKSPCRTRPSRPSLFLAPVTGGDFTTLRSAVQGRPGIFVRASQDLAAAGFEQARIEKYVASMRELSPVEAADPKAAAGALQPDCRDARAASPTPPASSFRPTSSTPASRRPAARRCSTTATASRSSTRSPATPAPASSAPRLDDPACRRRTLLRLRRQHRRPGPHHGLAAHGAVPVHSGDRVPAAAVAQPAPQYAAVVSQPEVGDRHWPAVGPADDSRRRCAPPNPKPVSCLRKPGSWRCRWRARRWSSRPASRMIWCST